MPVDFLSDEQVARYGRFAAEPLPGELEMFFRLDERALTHARSKRAPANRLGLAVQWGAVRMLGSFVTEDLKAVPEVVVRFAAAQVGVDPAEFGAYAERWQSRYEHAWEVRDAFGYTEFESAEEQVCVIDCGGHSEDVLRSAVQVANFVLLATTAFKADLRRIAPTFQRSRRS
ncbi:DUF4158 domain-containing protein [Actinomadura sp. NPDC048394]|uniref:DUF4158 domain-containing protein n=1 Tax=Actinomadura sp. NPDC048394 TaxID=3158223 RepID=UPI0033E65DD8